VSGFTCQDFEFEQRVTMDNYQRLGRTMNPVERASVPAGFSSSRTPEYGWHRD
jgi:hypothetical protein